MKKLDLYIIKKYLGTFFFSLAMILMIVVVFDLSEKWEKLLENKAGFWDVVIDYYFNFIPYFANTFASLFAFISVIFFTSKMASNSEIIAVLSSGISFRRLLIPYMISATIVAVFTFTLAAFIIPNANEKRLVFEAKYLGKKYNNKEQNIHRQLDNGVYMYMSGYSAQSNVGYDFSLEHFNGDTMKSKLTASRIVWNKDSSRWEVSNWTLRTIDGDNETYTIGKRIDTTFAFQPEEFSENPDKIKERLTLPELKAYEDRMSERGSSNVIEFKLQRYKMYADAFSTFILTLIGASVASRKMRGGMGFHLAIGLAIGFSYILFMRFSTVFALSGNTDPLLSVWTPNLLYMVIAMFAYRLAPK